MKVLRIKNYIVDTPLFDIIKTLQFVLKNGKLKDVQIKESTDEIIVTCPNDLHDGGHENNPDCHINLRDNTKPGYGVFHCFACGASGSFTHFVALCFSSSDTYAEEWLISKFGKKVNEAVHLGEDIMINNCISFKQKSKTTQAMLDSYQPWSPYLQKRGLSREICEKFKVKYDSYARQIVFPVYDKNNNILMAPRRSIDTKLFILEPDIEKPLYGLNIIEKNNINACMLVEGPIDNLSCWSHGVPAIATLGSPSIEQIKQINRSCISLLYLAFDNDEAGKKFNSFVKQHLAKRILTIDIQLPPDKKDVNDLSNEEWEKLINFYKIA